MTLLRSADRCGKTPIDHDVGLTPDSRIVEMCWDEL